MELFYNLFHIGLTHYLILAAMLFCIGLLGILISKNIIRVLMSLEILLNAVNINFIAFANYTDLDNLTGHIFTLFIMAIAAAEIAVALSILISLYRNKATVNIEDYNELKG